MARRILAVDDNEIVSWTLAMGLRRAGYEVVVAKSARAAFGHLAVQAFDLILLDLNMPDMDGLEALKRLKGLGLCPSTPVVLLTSSDELEHIQAAKAMGAAGYLTKAHAIKALVGSVDKMIRSPGMVWLDDHHCLMRPAEPRRAAAR